MHHAPSKFTDMVTNVNTGLSASVNTPTGRTKAIPLQIGLYQGDPLSVTMFNTVMNNTYLEGLKRFRQSGYRFSKSVQSLYVLQYAYDTYLVSDGPAACRAMLSYTDQSLQWSKMKAQVCICQCLAIAASSSKVFDLKLGGKIRFVGNEPVKFLGGIIQIPSNPSLARDAITDKLASLLV